jgi:hypothetical protein
VVVAVARAAAAGQVLVAAGTLQPDLTVYRFTTTRLASRTTCRLTKHPDDTFQPPVSVEWTPRGDGLVITQEGWGFAYCKLTAASVTYAYHANPFPVAFSKFRMLCEDGSIVADQARTTSDGVRTELSCFFPYSGASAHRRRVLMLRDDDTHVDFTAVGVGTPDSLPAWLAKLTGISPYGFPSDDGEVACIRYTPPTSRVMEKLLALPVLAKVNGWLPQRKTHYIAFYTRPGRLRARLPFYTEGADYFGTFLHVDGEQRFIRGFTLSPDGHRLAVLADGTRGQECLVYGW